MTEVERLERAAIDVGHVALPDAQPVDLEIEREGFERLLPAALLDRRAIGGLGAHLAQVEMHGGMVEQHVGHHAAPDQRPPVDAGDEPAHVEHGRIGIVVLDDRGLAHLDGGGERMEAQTGDRDGVAAEPPVDLRFHVAARRLVEDAHRDPRGDHEQRDRARDPQPTAMCASHAGARVQGTCHRESGVERANDR